MQAAAPTAPEVHEALARVLARPEFTTPSSTGLSAWLTRVREDLAAAFWSLMERLHLTDVGGGLFVWVLWFWLAVTALLLVAHIVSSLAGIHRGRLRPSPAVRPGA